MKCWPQAAGVALGLVLGVAVLALGGSGERRAESGPILSECDGRLRELVIHYEPSAKAAALPVYREFLPALEAGVTVQVVCPGRAAYRELVEAVGLTRCALRPMLVRHAVTAWSRDRWIPLAPARAGAPAAVLSPRGEVAEEIWSARAGDERVGLDLAAASGGKVRARRSGLYFDGGDLLADAWNVFVTPRILERNVQHTAATSELLVRQLENELGKRVVLLREAPDHHAGMFMCSAGNRTMLVGDPELGRPLIAPAAAPGIEPDFSPQTQRLFDAVAEQCRAEGYRVIRIPTVVSTDGRTYLTYLNALIDDGPGGRLVYLPRYEGCAALNRAAREVWAGLGYRVRPVDCTTVYRHFGCLHCLVNVLRREPAPEARLAASTPRRTVR